MSLDFTTELGKRALEELTNEPVIWLTTVTPTGIPQPNPVWFIWHDDSIIIWVQPDSARIRNIKQNPKVSLHLANDSRANKVTVITGEAEIDKSLGSLIDSEIHMAKYAQMWPGTGMNVEEASREYSLPLRIRPMKLRGF